MPSGSFPHRLLPAPIASFQRDAKLLLAAVFLDGIAVSGMMLFFNFFILSRGYGLGFLGAVNSIPAAVALIFGFPLGRLADRIGYRSGMLLGLAISYSAFGVALVALSPAILLAAMAFQGAGSSLYYLSVNPFLMKHSGAEERSMLFSLNVGLQTLAGAGGNLVAGLIPGWLEQLARIAPGTMISYQAVLAFGLMCGSLALIPIIFIRRETNAGPVPAENAPAEGAMGKPEERWLTLRMGVPNLFIGLGAALILPYMNIFFRQRYAAPDSSLGFVFSISAILTGLSTMLAPGLSKRLGSKIRAIVATQTGSLFFLLVLGFTSCFPLAVGAFLLRAILMNMSSPLYSAFCMEKAPEGKQGAVNGIIQVSWQAGWTVGPFLSGFIQSRWGFAPLFIIAAVLYGISEWFLWRFFANVERENWKNPRGNPADSLINLKNGK
jgi:MFS family permease